MKDENKEYEKDCITKCGEEFIECVENSGLNCQDIFNECSSVCKV